MSEETDKNEQQADASNKPANTNTTPEAAPPRPGADGGDIANAAPTPGSQISGSQNPGSQNPSSQNPSSQNQGSQTSGPPDMHDDEAMPEDAVAALNAQVEDLTKRLLVAHADIQNLHKRFDRERTETAKFAITKFARDTVAVADNFERAIASVPEGAIDDNPVLKALLDGVTMTEREFLNVLERHGVKRIVPTGEIFDPHRFQAVMEETDRTVPAGTVLKVFQPGYQIEERVLRPAMVVVAKGGPKPIKGEAPDAAAMTATNAPADDPQEEFEIEDEDAFKDEIEPGIDGKFDD